MSLWRQLTHGLRALGDPRRAARDVADEVDHYLDEAVRALVARGLSPEEARRRARRELGPASHVRQEVRAYGWENRVARLADDLRHAGRRLRNDPVFAAVGVLTLGLGIGATTAMLSVADPVLFQPLPYPEPGRLVAVSDRGAEGAAVPVTFGTLLELAERSRSFEALAVSRPWQPALTGADEPERLTGLRVTAGYGAVLGVAPARGRWFETGEDRVGGPARVILSDGLWQRRFGGDGGLIGQDIRLDGRPYTVVGVMPKRFTDVTGPGIEIWTLLQYDASLPAFEGREWGHHLRMVGRLAEDVSVAGAAAELEAVARSPVAGFARPAWAALESGLLVAPLRDDVVRTARPVLLAMLAAVTLLLLIACVNVTHLLLARGQTRRGEFAMRAALGAGRSRLIGQVLTESLVLGLLGGTAGILLAVWGVGALVAISPADLPRLADVRLDATAFGLALGATTLVGIGVGLVPALRAADRPERDLGALSRRASGRHRWTRSALVVAEVALTLVLLVGAGLLIRSVGRLFDLDAGFDPGGRVVMQIQGAGPGFETDESTHAFFADVLRAVVAVPGVTRAALSSQLPLSGDADRYGVQTAEDVAAPDGRVGAFRYSVSPGYTETMAVPLLEGRTFDAADDAHGTRVALVSESLARSGWPGQSAIGRTIRVGGADLPPYTVVGVVADVKQISLSSDDTPAVYVPAGQWQFADRARWLILETPLPPESIVPTVKAAIWSVDADQPVVRVAALDDIVTASAAERRFALRVFQTFALLAVVLAAIGLYGVLSGRVAERVRELGVRSALGATRTNLLGLVVRQGMGLVSAGMVVGLAGTLVMTRGLRGLLYGVSETDPVTYAGVILLLFVVGLAACALPALRAARVDPALTLRAD